MPRESSSNSNSRSERPASGSASASDRATEHMTSEHVKLPKSVIAVLALEAAKRDRHRSYIIREVLAEAAARFQIKHAEEAAAPRRARKVA